MAKMDSPNDVPNIFKIHNIIILPVSRRELRWVQTIIFYMLTLIRPIYFINIIKII